MWFTIVSPLQSSIRMKGMASDGVSSKLKRLLTKEP